MQGAATSDNYIDEGRPRHSGRRVSEESPDSSLRRLADALLARGVEKVSIRAAGARTNEVLRVGLKGQRVLVWTSGPSFLTGCWQVAGSASDPEGAADRIAAGLAGEGR